MPNVTQVIFSLTSLLTPRSNSQTTRLQHARDGLASTASCEHCTQLSLKSRCRRLARKGSLSEIDPLLGVSNPLPPITATDEGQPPLRGASWGNQLDAVTPLLDPEEDDTDLLDFSNFACAETDSEAECVSLGSDDYEQDGELSPSRRLGTQGGR
ncbi:hypothetical protein GOODEAATRI_018311 [Goodea atripinnis]|uniref:Uncharacterized protein n=1 Tax=Goodea atripinnis TaxID=208336 RepID=A0ABV0PZ11_9TELE